MSKTKWRVVCKNHGDIPPHTRSLSRAILGVSLRVCLCLVLHICDQQTVSLAQAAAPTPFPASFSFLLRLSKYTSPEPPAIFPARSPDTLGGPVAPPPPPGAPSQDTHGARLVARPTAADGAALVTGVHSQGCDSISLYARIFFSHGHVCRQSFNFLLSKPYAFLFFVVFCLSAMAGMCSAVWIEAIIAYLFCSSSHFGRADGQCVTSLGALPSSLLKTFYQLTLCAVVLGIRRTPLLCMHTEWNPWSRSPWWDWCSTAPTPRSGCTSEDTEGQTHCRGSYDLFPLFCPVISYITMLTKNFLVLVWFWYQSCTGLLRAGTGFLFLSFLEECVKHWY